ncbi:MAG TPA: hypothetical protein VKZ53_22440 [Candidatus Angelobacter sp.]|nr:hypothetical protein [Candidatus Angelobacter sp.]
MLARLQASASRLDAVERQMPIATDVGRAFFMALGVQAESRNKEVKEKRRNENLLNWI